MNFLDFVRKIKVVNRGKVCIVKSGIFYYALEKDALVLEKYCRLKNTTKWSCWIYLSCKCRKLS